MADPDRIETALREPRRLAALEECGLLDEPAKDTLERYVRLLRNALGAPIALVSLVDDHRQFFANSCGLPAAIATARETPLTHSFCKHVVTDGRSLIVNDSLQHPALRDNPAIEDLCVQAYAGAPIRTEDGLVLGSFCAIDDHPREWTASEIAVLEDLAAVVGEVVDQLRRTHRARLCEKRLAQLNDALIERRDRQDHEARGLAGELHASLSVMSIGVENLLEHVASHSYPEIAKLLAILRRDVIHADSVLSRLKADGSPAGGRESNGTNGTNGSGSHSGPAS